MEGRGGLALMLAPLGRQARAHVETTFPRSPRKIFFFLTHAAGDDRRSADARPQVARQPQHRNNTTRQARGRTRHAKRRVSMQKGFLLL